MFTELVIQGYLKFHNYNLIKLLVKKKKKKKNIWRKFEEVSRDMTG